jgi:hypothetical protein
MRAFRSLDELYQRQDGAWKGVHEGEGTAKIIDRTLFHFFELICRGTSLQGAG